MSIEWGLRGGIVWEGKGNVRICAWRKGSGCGVCSATTTTVLVAWNGGFLFPFSLSSLFTLRQLYMLGGSASFWHDGHEHYTVSRCCLIARFIHGALLEAGRV